MPRHITITKPLLVLLLFVAMIYKLFGSAVARASEPFTFSRGGLELEDEEDQQFEMENRFDDVPSHLRPQEQVFVDQVLKSRVDRTGHGVCQGSCRL